MPQMTSLRSTGASTVYLIKSVSHFTEAGAASCLYSRFAVKQNLSRHSWYLASQVKLNPTWLSLCALWKGNTHSHVCGHRAESLPRRWFLPKTKVVLIYLPFPKESKRNSRIYNTCASESLSMIWPVLVSLNLQCDSLKLKATLWEPPAAEVNNEIWFPTALNLNELPGSLPCCKDSRWATAVLNRKLCPQDSSTTPRLGPLDGGSWELLSPSHPCKPLQSKTGIQRLQSAFHTPAPGGLCLCSEPFHLAASRRRYPNW